MDRQEHVGNRIDRLKERQGDLAERLSGLTGDREGNTELKARLEGRQEQLGNRLERFTDKAENISDRLDTGDYGPKKQRPRMAGDAVASQNAATGASTPGG
jgi:predicted nuclease with TOPRIM domain